MKMSLKEYTTQQFPCTKMPRLVLIRAPALHIFNIYNKYIGSIHSIMPFIYIIKLWLTMSHQFFKRKKISV